MSTASKRPPRRACTTGDIQIHHADSGIFVSGANNTISDVVWTSAPQRDSGRHSTGHHGITLGGVDQLFSDFDFRTKFIHDITMSRGSSGNVVRHGRGEDLTFDHHKYANHDNLFTQIDAGTGTNIFRSGGGAKLGRHCGAWTTWWNIQTERPVAFPAEWCPTRSILLGSVPQAPRRPIHTAAGLNRSRLRNYVLPISTIPNSSVGWHGPADGNNSKYRQYR